MRKFLNEHIIELLLAVIVSLLTYIGNERLQNIEKEWSNLRSPIALMAVDSKMTQISEALLVKDLPDLTMADPTLCDLPVIISKFEPTLEKSKDGQHVLNRLNCLRDGMVAYINKDWKKAIDNFEKLDSDSSLQHRLLGGALFRQAEDTTNPNEADELRKQSKAHLEIEQKGFADYNTFYNLAALYSRTGKNEDCLKYFRIYLEKGGKSYDKRSQPEGDYDFRDFIMKSESSCDFNGLLSEMEP